MTEAETCKIEQLLQAFATEQEASRAFEEEMRAKVEKIESHVRGLSRVSQGALEQGISNGRQLETMRVIQKKIFEKVFEDHQDKQHDTFPAPPPDMDHDEITQSGVRRPNGAD